MNAQNKVARMARAATEMVEQLSRGTRRGQLKVGLVPFFGHGTNHDAGHLRQAVVFLLDLDGMHTGP